MALMQDKIYNLDQKSAKQAILDLTFEKDRLKILGEYDVKATKVDNTANKSAELKALQNKRNVELVALQLKFEAQRAELQRDQEETGRKTLEGLRNELKIKKAVTQAERDSLRIAYEMELLKEGGTVAKSDLPRIQALKEQLAAPVLGDDLIRQQIGALSDELLVLTDLLVAALSTTPRCLSLLKAAPCAPALWVKLVLKPSCPCAVAATAT
jgi:hypothetical protein